jgi:hypothetical protein
MSLLVVIRQFAAGRMYTQLAMKRHSKGNYSTWTRTPSIDFSHSINQQPLPREAIDIACDGASGRKWLGSNCTSIVNNIQ